MTTSALYPTIRPKLILDFVNRRTIDPRISFARASTASYIGKDRLLKVAPTGQPRLDHNPSTGSSRGLLIEPAGSNLFTYSSQFDNAVWTKSNVSVTRDGTIAPDGTNSAFFLRENTTATVDHSVRNATAATITAGSSVTFSVYVRKYTFGSTPFNYQTHAYAARTWIQLLIYDSSTTHICRAWFNLGTEAGSKGSTSIAGTLGAIQSYNIVNAGNNWHRVDITCLFDATITSVYARMQLATGDLNSTYTGDGESGMHVWGAQLESNNVATSYIPSTETFSGRTTAGTYYNSSGTLVSASNGVARYTYNPSNLTLPPTLLLELARTNICLNSSDFGSWTDNDMVVTSNAMVAPDGTTTADTTAYKPGTAGTRMQYITVTQGSRYTYSVHVKPVDATKLLRIYVDGAAGTFIKEMYAYKADDNAQSNIQKLANGWYRIWITFIAGSTQCVVHINPVDASLHGWWGAQLEAGAGPSAYIPTTTTSVQRTADTHTSAAGSRAADDVTVTGVRFSPWYNATEGSIIAEFDQATFSTSVCCAVSDGTSSNFFNMYTTNTNVTMNTVSAAVQQALHTFSGAAPSLNTTIKASTSYKANDFAGTVNGALLTDQAGAVPVAPNKLNIGSNYNGTSPMMGHIRRLTYYNQRLTDAQLQVLTS